MRTGSVGLRPSDLKWVPYKQIKLNYDTASLFAERQGFFLRCATKALRDNEPRVSHPGFPYK